MASRFDRVPQLPTGSQSGVVKVNVKEHPDLTALRWCHEQRAHVRFEIDGTVTVKTGTYKRRRQTLWQAVSALQIKEPTR